MSVSFTPAQSQVNVKFTIDMSLLAGQGKFAHGTDRILVRGSFNSWGDQTVLARQGTSSIYSVTLPLAKNGWFDYKYFITAPGAANSGWEEAPAFGLNGNRELVTGTNAYLNLPVVFFNNADMALRLETANFKYYSTTQDIEGVTAISKHLDANFSRITSSLEVTIPQKTSVYIWKSLDHYHDAVGAQTASIWSVGSAQGRERIQMATDGKSGPNSHDDLAWTITHEFIHIAQAWKTTVDLPIWLNEGNASYLATAEPAPGSRQEILAIINRLGHLPDLAYMEVGSEFGDRGGYGLSYTVSEFIIKTHGMSKMAKFVERVQYSDLGYASKTALQTAWQTYLSNYYVNLVPPVIAIGELKRNGQNWLLNYSPHPDKDADNNTLSYVFTLTIDGKSTTYTDTQHTGAFPVNISQLPFKTTFTLTAKAYDGFAYTPAANTKIFTTANTLPSTFSFIVPSDNQVISYNSSHKIRIYWTSSSATDADGDRLTDRIIIERPGFEKIIEVAGGIGNAEIDSTDLQAGTTYTLRGERSDGYDLVSIAPITFRTPGISGILEHEILAGLSVYPVPASDRVTLEGQFSEFVSLETEIYSAQGQRLFSDKMEIQGTFSKQIDVSRFPPGLYFLSLTCKAASGVLNRKSSIIICK